MSKLPQGWITAELDNVLLRIVGGGTPNKSNPDYFLGDIPFMTVKDMKNFFPSDTQDKISKLALENSSTKLIPANTLIVATRMGLGKICRLSFDVAINQDLKALFPSKEISKNFLFYWIRSQANHIENLGKGTTVKGIRLKDLKSLHISLPPLNEQKRIAKKLDQILAEISSANLRLQKFSTLLKNFRHTIIRSAITGRLSVNSIEDGFLFPNTWKSVSLDEIGELARGRSKHRPRNDSRLFGGDYPFIQTGDIANANEEIVTHTQTYNEFGLKQSRLFPAGTLCITIAANIADTAILSYPACFPDSVVGFIADEHKVDKYFIKYFIDSVKVELESFAPATAQKNINLKTLREIRIPLPSLHEQKKIVRKVRLLFTLVDQIEERYKLAVEQVGKITQSVFARAFCGKLIPQDPNDEPASIFLERIKAEKELQTLKPEQKKSRTSSKKAVENRKMISSILDTLKKEKKTLTAQSLLEKSGYPVDSDPEKIEEFFLDIKKSLIEGTVVRERVKNEDTFKLAV